jgi:hypothetical protein
VTARINPVITITRPKVSEMAGTWPKTGHAIKAANPGANAGNTAALEGPSSETIFE